MSDFKHHIECTNFRMKVTPLTQKGYGGTCRFKSWCDKGHNLTEQPVNASVCRDFFEDDCCIQDTTTGERFNQSFFPPWWIDRFQEQKKKR